MIQTEIFTRPFDASVPPTHFQRSCFPVKRSQARGQKTIDKNVISAVQSNKDFLASRLWVINRETGIRTGRGPVRAYQFFGEDRQPRSGRRRAYRYRRPYITSIRQV